jgi:hypothetical protein
MRAKSHEKPEREFNVRVDVAEPVVKVCIQLERDRAIGIGAARDGAARQREIDQAAVGVGADGDGKGGHASVFHCTWMLTWGSGAKVLGWSRPACQWPMPRLMMARKSSFSAR